MNTLPRCFFIDTCVWLDFFFPTRPDHETACDLLGLLRSNQLGIYCSSGVMQNLSYLAEALMKRELRARGEEIDDVSGYVTRQFAWSCVQNVRKLAGLVGADEQDVWFAEKYHRVHPDFEDDLVLAAAKRCEADLLVTNDKALLAHAVVPAMSSSDALTLLRELYAGS